MQKTKILILSIIAVIFLSGCARHHNPVETVGLITLGVVGAVLLEPVRIHGGVHYNHHPRRYNRPYYRRHH